MAAEIVPILKSVAKALFAGLAIGYIGFGALLFFMQPRLVYHPSREISYTPHHAGLVFDDLRLDTADGEKIAAWHIAAETGSVHVLLFHGNGGNMSGRVEVVRGLHAIGLNVLIIDYRGYGQSSGKPSEKGTYEDALAAWEYLVETKGVSPGDIVVYGRSLGASIAAWLAAEKRPGALMLESPFTSIGDMAKKDYPFMPVRALCRFKYDTVSFLARVRCPVLVAHSPEDAVVPFEHGRAVFEAAGEPKRFLAIGGAHCDSTVETEPSFRAAVREFITEHIESFALQQTSPDSAS